MITGKITVRHRGIADSAYDLSETELEFFRFLWYEKDWKEYIAKGKDYQEEYYTRLMIIVQNHDW